MHLGSASSGPMIIVLEANDVIFAKITTGLHLDELEIDLSGVFQTVTGAARHVDRFVLVQYLYLVADRHSRGAAHYHPMLGAMVVHLQRQAAALLHHDELDLIA